MSVNSKTGEQSTYDGFHITFKTSKTRDTHINSKFIKKSKEITLRKAVIIISSYRRKGVESAQDTWEFGEEGPGTVLFPDIGGSYFEIHFMIIYLTMHWWFVFYQ